MQTTTTPTAERSQPPAPESLDKSNATPAAVSPPPTIHNTSKTNSPKAANQSRFARLLDAMAFWAQSRS